MLRFKLLVFLPFAIALIGLVWVAVFASRNKELKKLAEAQKPSSVWAALWPLPLLAVAPLVYLWVSGESWGAFERLLYLVYLVFLSGLGVVGLSWYAGFNLFVTAIPAAQEWGRGMSKGERRNTWRRATREFKKSRAS